MRLLTYDEMIDKYTKLLGPLDEHDLEQIRKMSVLDEDPYPEDWNNPFEEDSDIDKDIDLFINVM